MKYIVRIALLLVGASTLDARSFAQQTPQPAQPEATKGEVVLTSLSKPTFSPLARQANVEGDVIVDVTVRQDGTADATVVKGHPLLKQAALDSATQSRFECRACSAPLSYTLIYTFKRTSESSCCDGMGAPVNVEQEPQSYDEQGRRQTRVSPFQRRRYVFATPLSPHEESPLAEVSLP